MPRIRQKPSVLSAVETRALEESAFPAIFGPEEKIPTIVVVHFPELGKLAAMRFIEWVQQNPGGVISLPTGKTPEHFIKWVQRIVRGWEQADVKAELEAAGIDPTVKPDMKSLYFVQIDEFYPISPNQQNSFNFYVQKFYVGGFGLDPQKALLIDCAQIGLKPGEKIAEVWPDNHVDLSLRYRQARGHQEERQKAVLESVDQWCMNYEEQIKQLGGIGFFLGGIGPDGHIGFNIYGSDHHSTTRLCPINYETQAAAATDLGGIEIAKKCHTITIGLRTITRNPDCVALVIAAGEAKAALVAKAIESNSNIRVPASSLQELPNARFYITRGAAGQLGRRRLHVLETSEAVSDEDAQRILIDLSAATGKRLVDLREKDCQSDKLAGLLLKRRAESLGELAGMTRDSIVRKIARGMERLENKTFLHTEPHHDDVMLGYFAQVVRSFRQSSNSHHFMTLTSGFTSVTNDFMKEQLSSLRGFLKEPDFRSLFEEGYFSPGDSMTRNRDIWQYLDGVAGQDEKVKAEGCARRLLRNLIETFEDTWLENLEERIAELENYFESQYPGKHDPHYIQQLKGMCREWEAECLWGYYGWKCDNVMHLRLGFYTGDIFTKDPTMEQDVPPIVSAMNRVRPDVLTVALDPEASGPDTHYKVLQALAAALRVHEEQGGRSDLEIWGYRNVWYRFNPADADVYVPVSLCMFSTMHEAFMNAFMSQRNASFPSYEYDGPFSQLAQQIQVGQYQKIKTCLGREWFNDHNSPLIRATRGLVFLKRMDTQRFYECCRELRRSVENS